MRPFSGSTFSTSQTARSERTVIDVRDSSEVGSTQPRWRRRSGPGRYAGGGHPNGAEVARITGSEDRTGAPCLQQETVPYAHESHSDVGPEWTDAVPRRWRDPRSAGTDRRVSISSDLASDGGTARIATTTEVPRPNVGSRTPRDGSGPAACAACSEYSSSLSASKGSGRPGTAFGATPPRSFGALLGSSHTAWLLGSS